MAPLERTQTTGELNQGQVVCRNPSPAIERAAITVAPAVGVLDGPTLRIASTAPDDRRPPRAWNVRDDTVPSCGRLSVGAVVAFDETRSPSSGWDGGAAQNHGVEHRDEDPSVAGVALLVGRSGGQQWLDAPPPNVEHIEEIRGHEFQLSGLGRRLARSLRGALGRIAISSFCEVRNMYSIWLITLSIATTTPLHSSSAQQSPSSADGLYFGVSIGNFRDIDQGGRAELIVGSTSHYLDHPDSRAAGRLGERSCAYIMSMETGVALDHLYGLDPSDSFGLRVLTDIDFNGDGYSELVVSSPFGGNRSGGYCIVYDGKSLTPSRLLTAIGAFNDLDYSHIPAETDGFGWSITAMGFGEGRERELLIGAPSHSPNRGGALFVYNAEFGIRQIQVSLPLGLQGLGESVRPLPLLSGSGLLLVGLLSSSSAPEGTLAIAGLIGKDASPCALAPVALGGTAISLFRGGGIVVERGKGGVPVRAITVASHGGAKDATLQLAMIAADGDQARLSDVVDVRAESQVAKYVPCSIRGPIALVSLGRDVDGNGEFDLLIGDSTAFRQGGTNGCVYLVSAESGRVIHSFDCGEGSNKAIRARYGSSITVTSDLDRDGCPDIAIGAPDGFWGGCVDVYSGRTYRLLTRLQVEK